MVLIVFGAILFALVLVGAAAFGGANLQHRFDAREISHLRSGRDDARAAIVAKDAEIAVLTTDYNKVYDAYEAAIADRDQYVAALGREEDRSDQLDTMLRRYVDAIPAEVVPALTAGPVTAEQVPIPPLAVEDEAPMWREMTGLIPIYDPGDLSVTGSFKLADIRRAISESRELEAAK
jgi:hypothetical protein